MGMISEFKEFAIKGNMMDMAVGIIIGGAFGKIISSLVADVIMPPIGVLMGGVDFTDLGYTIQAATADAPAVVLKYGNFVQTALDFLIIAFAVFMMVKMINSMKKKQEEAPSAPPKQEMLLEEIRDLLKK
ncbi:MAG: large-conductance mechanosensitive channel protein MscL [Gammaproteobacteria bacterium]